MPRTFRSFDDAWWAMFGALGAKDARPQLLEECAEAAHNEWMAEKRRRGVTTWPNERGFEQMVPYAQLEEDVKDFDRVVVGAIMSVLAQKGIVQ